MRYFVEVAYKGTNYAGFQVQRNANTIQGEVEKAFAIYFQKEIILTGSSRTDAGVHALQNYFHFDWDGLVHDKMLYNLNAILPVDISIKKITLVDADTHCRFDAVSREYHYYISQVKSPFLNDRSWYFPYRIDLEKLNEAAQLIMHYTDFTSFAKRNSQVFTHQCTISKSQWSLIESGFVYEVKANRFLRGMVRGLVGTMLLVGRGKAKMSDFREVIEARDCTKANFATPPHGLFLAKIEYSFFT